MANETVDNLNIKLSADADKATKALNSLANSLNGISNALSKDVAGMRKFSKEIGKVTAAVREIGKVKVDVGIGNMLASLGKINDSEIGKASENIKNVASSLEKLGKAQFKESGINNTVNAINRLLKTDFSGFNPEAFQKITDSIRNLGNMPDISSGVNRFVSSLSRLANAGEKTGQSANDIYRLGQETKKAADELATVGHVSDDINMFVQSVGRLASAGGKTSQTAAGLGNLAEETKKFFKAMQDAPIVSENTIRMTQALAQLASAGGKVGSSTSTITSSFEKLSTIGTKTSSAMKKIASGIASAFKKIGDSGKHVKTAQFSLLSLAKTAIAFRVGYGLLEFGKQAFELGSSITEVENVVDTAFGNMADKAYEFADTAKEQFGLSELSAKKYAGTLMAMLNSTGVAREAAAEMSIGLAGLAGDLASFYNIDTDVAFKKLQSAMAGEIEPMRELGVNMTVAAMESYALSQGITKSWLSMTQAEQAMLRYNYIIHATQQASGDFLDTQHTFANQWRLLTLNVQQFSATIGQGLIAAVLPAIQAINALFSVLQRAATAFRDFMYVLTGYKGETSGGFVNDMATGIEGIGSAGNDAAGGLGNAAGAADDLKKKLSVLPFDELNQLSDNLSDAGTGGGGSGGTGGGGLPGIGDMGSINDAFANSELPKYINEWAERIRSAFLDHDWDRLGEEIAWGINVGIEAIYDAINWDNVGPKITAFTSAFTQTFNSLVDSINWDLMGRTIGTGINTLVNTLNQLIEGIDWINLGSSFAGGIMGIVDEVNWKGLGNLIGNYFMIAWNVFYGFVTDLDYKKIGDSLADGINGAIKAIDLDTIGSGIGVAFAGVVDMLYELAENIKWDEIGEQIADGINGFFRNFNFSKLAKTLNSWVRGLEKALFKAISKIDWWDIFSGLTDFIGNLDLDVTFLMAIPAIKKVKSVLDKIDTTKILKGFQGIKDIFKSDDFFGSLGTQIKKMQDKMTGLQKGALITIGVFEGFSLFKDAFSDIASGGDDLLEAFGEITAGVGVMVGTLKLVGLSNPFTAAITGATVLVGAITGISQKMEEVEAERFGEIINNAFTNPGGISLDEISNEYTNLMDSISKGFSQITDASSELNTANTNIQSTQAEIQRIQIAMDEGVISVEEGTKKLSELFSQLATIAEEKFKAMQLTLIGAFGEGGALQSSYENMGIETENLLQKTMQVNDKAMDRIKEIVQELSTMDPSNPKYLDLQQEMYNLLGTTDELKTAINDYKVFVDSTEIDLSKLIGEGELNSEYLTSFLDKIVSATQDAEGDISEAEAGINSTFNELLEQAKALGDNEAIELYNAALKQLPDSISDTNEEIALQAKAVTDTLQNQLIGEMSDIISQAQKEWEEMGPLDRLYQNMVKGISSEDMYVEKALRDYKTNFLTPISDEIENSMNELGISGARRADSAFEQIMSSLFNTDSSYVGGDVATVTTTLNSNWQSIIENFSAATEELAQFHGSEIGNILTDSFITTFATKTPEVQSSIVATMQAISEGISVSATQIQEVFSAMGITIPQAMAESFVSMEPAVLSSTLSLLSQMNNGQALKYAELVTAFSNLGINITNEGLLQSLEGQNANVQQATIMLLSQLEAGKSLSENQLVYAFQSLGVGIVNDGIISSLSDAEPSVQQQAIDLLGQIQSAADTERQPLIDKFNSLGIGTINDGLLSALNEMTPSARDEALELLSQISGASDEQRAEIYEKLKAVGIDAGSGLLEGMGSKDYNISEAGLNWAKEAIGGAKEGFDINSPSKKMKEVGNYAVDGLLQGLEVSESRIQNALSPTISYIINCFESLKTDLYNLGQGAIQSFINGFRSMTIPMPHITVSGWNQLALGNGGIMSIPNFGVNWYAAGGLFRNATIAGIGEDGDEAVLPLENRRTMRMISDSIIDNSSGGFGMNEEAMANAVARGVAMAMMNNQSSQPNITVYAELRTEDDEVLARAVARGQEKMDYRMNPTAKFSY